MADKKANTYEPLPPSEANEGKRTATEGTGEVAALCAANAEIEDRLKRAVAEADNIRKRGERALDEARRYALLQFAPGRLAVLDNRAIAAAELSVNREGKDTSLLESVRATERLLAKALKDSDVCNFDAFDAKFNPALYEAVMRVEDGSPEPGIVTEVRSVRTRRCR